MVFEHSTGTQGSMTSIQRNNVKISGNGSRAIMFAHGYGCDQAMWRAVAPNFEKDYKVILFDYVGAGHSDPTAFNRTHYSTLRGYALDVIEIIEELKLEKVNFVGHSVSSMIGALAAIERPELFENLVMIGPSPSYINDGDYVGGFERSDIEDLLEMLDNNHSGWSAMMAPIIMGNPDRPELADELEASFCSTDPIHAQHFARVTFLSDNRVDLLKLRARTLILQCDKDAIAPVAVGQYVQGCIPHSELIVMDATGHCPHLSAPGVVTEAIHNFL
ncbi:sigma-B regulation protein RsbQ [Granulicella rosea]|uniref:Sigma-B regulation protein RsbQ n=1 Tax=Granulicella rosea TaxID=474952 RepID=A0A239J0P8_9BACT|nr:alpha/beta hydrolase [Granulicella rosea]SNS99335.1 sigma-B regulation protein RsbQ [Granulicella rosea]